MKWNEKIPGCFGSEDSIFAGHHNDKERALELLRQCIAEGASLAEVSKEIEAFLRRKHPTPADQQQLDAHIAEQLKRVQERFGPWLS